MKEFFLKPKPIKGKPKNKPSSDADLSKAIYNAAIQSASCRFPGQLVAYDVFRDEREPLPKGWSRLDWETPEGEIVPLFLIPEEDIED